MKFNLHSYNPLQIWTNHDSCKATQTAFNQWSKENEGKIFIHGTEWVVLPMTAGGGSSWVGTGERIIFVCYYSESLL